MIMKKLILYNAMAVMLLVLGSCSTSNFISDTSRFNYVKTDKLPERNSVVETDVNKDSKNLISGSTPVEPVVDESLKQEPQKQQDNDGKPIVKTTKTPEKKEVTANSVGEEEELIEKAYSETSSRKRSYIAIPSPEETTKEKSQLTALLLCLILGMIGVHRFYLGKPLGGIIILAFTLIGLAYPPAFAIAGLIVLFDAIRLLFGGLGPGW
jgi:TM2 domain-containing membrane protein YozV